MKAIFCVGLIGLSAVVADTFAQHSSTRRGISLQSA